MTKKQRNLIDRARKHPYVPGTIFDRLVMIPTGVEYNGSWGKNGCESIVLVALKYGPDSDVRQEFLVNDGKHQVDIIDFLNYAVSVDVPLADDAAHVFYRGYKMVINSVDRSHVFVERVVVAVNEDILKS